MLDISITKPNALTTQITVTLEPKDYMEKCEHSLKNYVKNAQIPGFRKKASISMIKARYGYEIFFKVIGTMVEEEVDKYLQKHKPQLAIPPTVDYASTKELYKFYGQDIVVDCTLYLQPDFDVQVDDTLEVESYIMPNLSEKLIEGELTKLRYSYGELIPKEKASQEDLVTIKCLVAGKPITRSLGFSIKNGLNLFSTKIEDFYKGAQFPVDATILQNEKLHPVLKGIFLDAQKKKKTNNFSIEITEIYFNKPADLNLDFFTRALPHYQITDEASFRASLLESVTKYFSQLVQRREESIIRKKLVEKTFGTTYQDVPSQQLWDLIEQKIVQKANIVINPSEINRSYIKRVWIDFVREHNRQPKFGEAKKILSSPKYQERYPYDAIYQDLQASKVMSNIKANIKKIPFVPTEEQLLAYNDEQYKYPK